MDALPTLWHFRLSHYNEKARWALDWKGVPHRRRALLPGPHVPRIMWETGQRQVPVLRIDGETVADSSRIIATLEARHPTPALYPQDADDRRRALALEDFFDEELGPHIRRVFFYHVLPDAAVATAALAVGESALTQTLYRAAFPVVRAVMTHDLGIDDARAADSQTKVEAALARLEAEIQPAGYLVGTAFSVADLTVAALLSGLVRPPEFPYPPPPLPPPLATWRASLLDRPALRWAAEMYRKHRGTSCEVAA